MTIEEIIADFESLDDWEDRYRYLIELGREMPEFPDADRTDANKVRGCASQVWLTSHIERNDKGQPVLELAGDSDAHIVRGLVAVLMAAYSGRPAAEILAVDVRDIFQRLKLAEHLTPQRSNGFSSMVSRIRQDAAAALAAAP